LIQNGTTGGKSCSKTFLISVIPGGHFKFRPLEKNADIVGVIAMLFLIDVNGFKPYVADIGILLEVAVIVVWACLVIYPNSVTTFRLVCFDGGIEFQGPFLKK